jgi:hypothetical protein
VNSFRMLTEKITIGRTSLDTCELRRSSTKFCCRSSKQTMSALDILPLEIWGEILSCIHPVSGRGAFRSFALTSRRAAWIVGTEVVAKHAFETCVTGVAQRMVYIAPDLVRARQNRSRHMHASRGYNNPDPPSPAPISTIGSSVAAASCDSRIETDLLTHGGYPHGLIIGTLTPDSDDSVSDQQLRSFSALPQHEQRIWRWRWRHAALWCGRRCVLCCRRLSPASDTTLHIASVAPLAHVCDTCLKECFRLQPPRRKQTDATAKVFITRGRAVWALHPTDTTRWPIDPLNLFTVTL